MTSPQSTIASRLRELGVEEEIVFNTPPRPEMGDFSTPVALKLARSCRKKPLDIAGDLRNQLLKALPATLRDVQVSPPGFLNFFINDAAFAKLLIRSVAEEGENAGRGEPVPGKILVEHTNVNPNKAMHVGHLRNAILGDTLVRTLRWSGRTVEVCNYIDDTGVQVVDVVTAMLYLDEPFYDGGEDFDPIWNKAEIGAPFDYFCWDLYARVQDYLRPGATTELPSNDTPPNGTPAATLAEAEQARVERLQALKLEVMHAVEAQTGPVAKFARELATRIVHAHLRTAARLNVYYNLLNWESDILGAGFWSRTFELLKTSGAIKHESEGPNIGCWVVPMGGVDETAEGTRSRDKILVRSNGAATYTAKDIAYQLWKFGKLDRDFVYRPWGPQKNGEEIWTTAPDGAPDSRFGHADRVVNVIDTRQSYLQDTVQECLDRLGYSEEARNSIHLDYEVVKLSSRAAAELGVESEEGQGVNMSGRKGLGVKGDDLVNRMEGVIRSKNPDASLDAGALAAAAIRYYLVKFATNTIIQFDFEAASQTNGESGVYLVYSYARACNILAKAGGAPSLSDLAVPEDLTLHEKQLVREMGRFGDAIQQAAEMLQTTPLTAYAFGLASAFTGFYDHTPPIIREENASIKAFRLALVLTFRQVMKNVLDVLGIPALERI